MTIKDGDQVVAITPAYYTHKGAEGKQSQWVGDLLLVNGVRQHGVLGAVLHRGPGNPSAKAIGKATTLDAGTYRLATPDDPGYMATKEQWAAHMGRLRAESFAWGVVAILALGALALKVFP